MGALHAGHQALFKVALQRCDKVVVSVFVNPAQFGPHEDFQAYPRQRERDVALLADSGVHLAFLPSVEQIYPRGFSTSVDEGSVATGLCGQGRPGFFKGVCTVLVIFLNLVDCQVLVLGKKDAQQVAVLKRLVMDLCLDVEVVSIETARQANGLALSSRNVYLEPSQLKEAAKLHEALQAASSLATSESFNLDRVKGEVTHRLSQSQLMRIIYVEIVDKDTMKPEKELRRGRSLLMAAVWLRAVRLIDNVEL